ncbi:unnamed protein product [Didymodactylos carnosus]|uniref:Tyr recombinase domain-containing protein n=1 Tax=Didymodactylos carnosus TaxID=1234261 RepID=A0A8S2F203_9BILA|nr:unnamed protein product [Didymodactylos carnosus]CAF4182432.1 unnamed protein product [Didymodactylos carnosus]
MTKEFGQDTVEYGPQSGQQQQSPSYCGGLNYGQQSGQQQLPSTINVWAQSSDQPLFLTPTGQPLSRLNFIEKIRLVLSHLGFDAASYSGHSFRKGAATTAATCGLPPYIIQILGRWLTDSFKLYIELPLQTIQKAQQTLPQPS